MPSFNVPFHKIRHPIALRLKSFVLALMMAPLWAGIGLISAHAAEAAPHIEVISTASANSEIITLTNSAPVVPILYNAALEEVADWLTPLITEASFLREPGDLNSPFRLDQHTISQSPAQTLNFDHGALTATMAMALFVIVISMMMYGLRHLLFTFSRLFGRQRHPYIDIDNARWPMITVFIAAHNEEMVIAGCLEALLNSNYPTDRLNIVPVNDRSTDATHAIIDRYVARYPTRINPFHRIAGKPGKAAALKDALDYVEGDITLIFDADYVPGRGLLKQLVAPFFDPEVGAVMGRVVPMNVDTNLLTRLLDLERAGGYQVDQQARMNLKLVTQYGGTVGGVRMSAVEAVGGWHDDVLAEDTDITYRLLFNGWKTIYTNRSECYEEVPEDWGVRVKQVKRWSKGHNQVLARYWYQFLVSPYLSWSERLDGMMLLLVFLMPPLLLIGWLLAVSLYFLNAGDRLTDLIPVFILMAYITVGNFAAFFEIVIAVLLDGNRRRLRLLPLNLFGFFISMFSITSSVYSLVVDTIFKRELIWEKTIRYRKEAAK